MQPNLAPDAGVLGVAGLLDAVRVGQGSYGVVYRASQPAYGRTVAVKILTSPLLDEDSKRRFERECRGLGSLSSHPYIVTLHSAGVTEDGHPYLIMDYLPGGSLAARISAGPLGWEEVSAIGVKLASALAASHAQGVLHRDVKPENVLVSAYGEPQLADFGVAKIQGGTSTTSSTITGSLAHAAPEVISGIPATAASDIWSLASTLATLLLGHSPFHRPNDETLHPLITRILTQPPPDMRPLGVPSAICDVIESGLAKDSWERPQSALDFGHALQDAQRSSGMAPTPMAAAAAVETAQMPAVATPPDREPEAETATPRRSAVGSAPVPPPGPPVTSPPEPPSRPETATRKRGDRAIPLPVPVAAPPVAPRRRLFGRKTDAGATPPPPMPAPVWIPPAPAASAPGPIPGAQGPADVEAPASPATVQPVTPEPSTADVSPAPVAPLPPEASKTPATPVAAVLRVASKKPAAPVTPVTAVTPVAPKKPAPPVAPTAPVATVDSAAPVAPNMAEGPVAAAPVAAILPTAPVAPIRPIAPARPTAPIPAPTSVTADPASAPSTPGAPVEPLSAEPPKTGSPKTGSPKAASTKADATPPAPYISPDVTTGTDATDGDSRTRKAGVVRLGDYAMGHRVGVGAVTAVVAAAVVAALLVISGHGGSKSNPSHTIRFSSVTGPTTATSVTHQATTTSTLPATTTSAVATTTAAPATQPGPAPTTAGGTGQPGGSGTQSRPTTAPPRTSPPTRPPQTQPPPTQPPQTNPTIPATTPSTRPPR